MTRAWPLVLFALVAALVFARSPALAAGESISGTVTGPAGQALEGVCVLALDALDQSSVKATAGTAANGTYTLTGANLGAGDYKVRFQTGGSVPGCGAPTPNVVTEYWRETPDFASAEVITLGAGETRTGIDPVLAFGPGEVRGRVVTKNGLDGLPNACVALLEDSLAQTLIASTPTNANGDYSFGNLQPGAYKIVFDSARCTSPSAPIFTEYYEDKASFALATSLQVAGNTVTANPATVDSKPDALDDDSPRTNEDTPLSIPVLANDTDVDNPDEIQIASASDPANGTAAVQGAEISYTPDANYNGTDSFNYTVNGGDTATVRVTVRPVDDPPTAVDDEFSVDVAARDEVLDVTANDSDIDGGVKRAGAVTQPAHGFVQLSDAGVIRFTPENYCGPDAFTYTLIGGSTARVDVSVECPNGLPPADPTDPTDPADPDEPLEPDDEPPVAEDDRVTVAGGSGPTRIRVLANDTDPDGGPMRIVDAGGAVGNVVIVDGGAALTYQPAANFCGEDEFTYRLIGESEATVFVTVACDIAGAPQTTIKKAPKRTIRTKKKRVKVKFFFTSSEAVGAAFRCRLDKRGFERCKSPASYRLRPGRHTFRVYAIDSLGNVDPSPAKAKVRVIRKRPKRGR